MCKYLKRYNPTHNILVLSMNMDVKVRLWVSRKTRRGKYTNMYRRDRQSFGLRVIEVIKTNKRMSLVRMFTLPVGRRRHRWWKR